MLSSLSAMYESIPASDYCTGVASTSVEASDVNCHSFEWLALHELGRVFSLRDYFLGLKDRSLRLLPIIPGRHGMPLFTALHYVVTTKWWSSDPAEHNDEDGRAVAHEVACNYQIAARFEAAFSVMLGADAEIVSNARVPVHSVGTVDDVADVIYRALSKGRLPCNGNSAVAL